MTYNHCLVVVFNVSYMLLSKKGEEQIMLLIHMLLSKKGGGEEQITLLICNFDVKFGMKYCTFFSIGDGVTEESSGVPGASTWHSLFPGAFSSTYGTPSPNVGCIQHNMQQRY